MIGLTKTWLKPGEFTVLNEAPPLGYTSDHIPHASRKGGGVANIYDSKFKSFQFLVMKSIQPTQSLFIATVYRFLGHTQRSSLSSLNSYWTL